MSHPMKHNPEISVIIPAFGSKQALLDTLVSLDEQSFTDWEAIVTLDYPQRALPSAIQSLLDRRYTFISFSKNEGLGHAYDGSLQKARGKYIAFAKSGDIQLPLRLEKQYAFMEDNLDLGACAGNIQYITPGIDHIDQKGAPLITKPRDLICRVLWGLPLYPNTLMIRHWLTRKHALLARFARTIHYEWISRIKKDCPFANLNVPMVAVRAHPEDANFPNRQSLQDRRLIWAFLLRELGFRGDGAELDLHALVVQQHAQITPEIAARAEVWLTRLYQANQVYGVYPKAAFRNYLQEHWLKFMAGASRWGIQFGQQFSRSPLSPYPEYSFWQKSSFWARALLRR